MIYCVKYQAATYSGVRKVSAESEHEAIQKVKAWVHKEMTLPMYSESYKIVQYLEEVNEDDE